MFFYISFSNGQANWCLAPLALLVLNQPLFWRLLELPFSLLRPRQDAGDGLWAGRGWPHQFMSSYSGLLSIVVTGLLTFVLFKLVKLVRERGIWGALRAALLTGFRGGTWQNGRVPRSQKDKFDQVAKCINGLPIEKYASAESLSRLSVHELKERLAIKKVDVRQMKEKSELIQALATAGGSTDTSCSICFEDYVHDDDLRVLPCGHKFHLQCIDRWFLSSTDYTRPPACPYCNSPLPIEPV